MSFLFLGFMLFLSLFLGFMASNWFFMVLLMEITLFSFLFMIFDYNNLSFCVPSIKYFFSQTLGSIMLMVSGLFFGLYMYMEYFFGIFFLLMGLCMKLGIFPFHFWVVPTWMELPYFMLIMLGIPLKVLPLILLYDYVMENSSLYFSYLLLIISCMSMLVGMMLGLWNKTIRGILGASSVTHSGWFLMAAVSGSLLNYFVLYSITLFFVLFSLLSMSYWYSTILMIALAGLPPFGVFIGKLLILINYFQLNLSVLFIVPALVSSVVSLIYYLKFSFSFYFMVK